MMPDFSRWRIFVRPGPTDLRKAANGLMILAEQTMGHNPFGQHLFLFCNGDRTLLKALYWDRTGFCLWQKRLEKDRFPWPKDEAGAREIDVVQLRLLLSGIDFWKAHQSIEVTRVS
jgi:transposase